VNVLYLHQHFATRSGAGGTRSYEFARYLLRQGHQVTMITAQREAGGVHGEGTQKIDGIDVVSLGGWYSNHLTASQRIRQFLRFSWRASRLHARDLPVRPDVVIATSTPLTIGIPGVRLARRFGVPFVFEVRDLWPQAPIELGKLRNPLAKWAARRLERSLYAKADRVIALSPGMERGVLAAGTDPAKVTTIPNASDLDLFTPERSDRSLLARFGVADSFVAVHGGSMGEANGLDYLVRAAKVLDLRGADDVRILVCGYGGTRPKLEAMCAELGITNVVFTGSIPRAELGAIVSSCDCAITSFANYPVLATNSPNKFFDALAAGLPVIVNSPGWTRDIVQEHDCGAYVSVRDPAQLADALLRLRDDADLRARQGANARELARSTYARELLAARFCDVLLSTVGGARPGSRADEGQARQSEAEAVRA
jgi:glycosyltransferase involved in cell wall biosynthesis